MAAGRLGMIILGFRTQVVEFLSPDATARNILLKCEYAVKSGQSGVVAEYLNLRDLRNTLIDYWRQVHKKYGYVECSTPMMMNRQLWERSGHWGHYKNNMYTTVIDETDFAIKPSSP